MKIKSSMLYQHAKVWDYLMLAAGTGLTAFGLQCIYEPMNLIIGGFTGISIIIKRISEDLMPGGIPLWMTNMILNIPVFVSGYKIKGGKFLKKALFGTISLSVWLYVIPEVNLAQGDYTLAAIFGGVISGAGLGLVLLAKATTGGTDMVATLIHHYLKQYSIIQIIQILDGLIVLCGLFVFGLRGALYALVAIFITSKVSDTIMEGLKFSKVAYIITEQYELTAKRIMEEIGRGATGLKAQGMYSGKEECVLYCVVSKKEIIRVKEIVASVDAKAFVIVSDAREVFGEGFLTTM